MPTTAEGRTKATRLLTNLLRFDDHVIIGKHINNDARTYNFESLAEERLSSGERIAVEVLQVIVNGSSRVKIQDLYEVDDDYRRVLLEALRLALIGDDGVML